MDKQQLLGEIEELFRLMPKLEDFNRRTPEATAWAGRAKALLKKWDAIESISLNSAIENVFANSIRYSSEGYTKLTVIVQQARHDLLLETIGPRSIAIAGGAVFDYFDEIRKIAETAKTDLFFIDPYLNADFVSRYLKTIPNSVSMRLLGSKPAEISSLVPSIEALCKQNGSKISVRSTPQLHDRYVFIDRVSCYQSGSSFKDGAKKSPVVITQIIDAFAAVQVTYENLWSSAKIEL